MKTPVDIRIDQLRNELREAKAEIVKLKAKRLDYIDALIQMCEAFADYAGKYTAVGKKLLSEAKGLREYRNETAR